MLKLKSAMETAKTMPTFGILYPQIVDNLVYNLSMLENTDKQYVADAIEEDVYTLVYGPHFDKETALMAVSEMKNVDGTMGEHWDMEQTTMAAKQSGIVFNKYNECDFYYVLNMLYSDNYGVFGNDSNTYIQLAMAWLDDPDVPEGKAWRYYKKVVKA